MKILIVEDNFLNQKILSFHFQKRNYFHRVASSGENGVDLYRSEWYDVVLMDLMLPGISGYEAVVQMREVEKERYGERKTFIIALTANTLDNEMEKCLLGGMDGYLAKPFDMAKLDLIFETLQIGNLENR